MKQHTDPTLQGPDPVWGRALLQYLLVCAVQLMAHVNLQMEPSVYSDVSVIADSLSYWSESPLGAVRTSKQ